MEYQSTLPKAFAENVRKRGSAPFLYYKKEGEWKAASWDEVGERVKCVTLGLMALGVKKGDRISPISNTIPEMAYCCLAVATSGAIFAPIYHTNSPKECTHVINDAGSRIAFAENRIQLDKLKKAWPECPNLEKIIVFETEGKDSDQRVMSIEDLIGLGKGEYGKDGDKVYNEKVESVEPGDVSAIIYTSGTTGAPKGVMFSNEGFIKHLNNHTKLFPVSEKSRGLSFLPMAHALELMDCHWRHVYFGFAQIYTSVQTLYDDVLAMKPTFLFQTPRFYEKIYNQIRADIDAMPGWKKGSINLCLKVGARYQDMRYGTNKGVVYGVMYLLNALCHRVFFKKVHAPMGGRVEWATCGASPVPAKTLLFFKACGFPIYEGYGLTESPGVVSQNMPGAVKVGTIGKPMPGLEVKVADDGEILVRGWAKSLGYWNNPEATKALFADGWLCTGDLGFLDDEGFLHINGRKKEVIITATGKNVTPSNIQNLLKSSPYISEAVVLGEGQMYLTALLTLNEENVVQYAKQNDIGEGDFSKLIRHKEVLGLIGKEIEVKNQDLARIEQIRKFVILENQFCQDQDELTATGKVKRRVIEKRYMDQIQGMYKDN